MSNWSPTGNLVQSCSLSNFNLLNDNRVLLTGGQIDPSNSISLIQVYNSTTQTWSNIGTPGSYISLSEPKTYHTSTKLNDGRVLIAGGYNNSSGIISSVCNIFNPITNTISIVTPLNYVRQLHSAVLLANGNVLVTGGISNILTSVTNYCEIYDPNTNTWTSASNMESLLHSHKSILLPNNKVLVVGGYDGNTYTNKTQIYDPTTDTWTYGPNIGGPTGTTDNYGRIDHTLTLLDNGFVLISGGRNYDSGNTWKNNFLYDYNTNLIVQTTDMNLERAGHYTIKLNSGRILVIAGDNEAKNCEIYNPDDQTWTTTVPFNSYKINFSSVLLSDGTVLAAGGGNTSEVYTPLTYNYDKITESVEKILSTQLPNSLSKLLVTCTDLFKSGNIDNQTYFNFIKTIIESINKK